jgi:hypothetical protein
LSNGDLASKLICFGVNDIIIFKGSKIDVNVQMTQKHAPLMMGIHHMTHHYNLAIQTLSSIFEN